MRMKSTHFCVVTIILCSLFCGLGSTLLQESTKLSNNHRPKTDFGPSCSLLKWNRFKEKYSKDYDSPDGAEDEMRREIFCKNLYQIFEHNAKEQSTYTMELNQFSDLTSDEINMMTQQLNDANNQSLEMGSEDLERVLPELTSLFPPDEVDWSLDGSRVSRARMQGNCGSCWAFAVVGMIEGQQKPAQGTPLVELSEQNLVDCDNKCSGCWGCSRQLALEGVERNGGIMPLADYPYVSGKTRRPAECKMNRTKFHNSTRNLGDIVTLKAGDEFLLKRMVASYGPVSAGIQVKPELLQYKEGVFYAADCQKQVSHSILIVGYGRHNETGQDYWKIKNSWGEGWGQRGFGLMSRNRGNNCLIAQVPVIVLPGGK